MYKTRKEMLAKPVYKTLLIILVIAVCFVFAYIKDVSAASVNDADYGQLMGTLYGKHWSMSSVVLKRKVINGFENLVLEFNEKVISESELCKDDALDTKKLLVQIPIRDEKDLRAEDEEISIRMNGSNDMHTMGGFRLVKLNDEDLGLEGKAFVRGNIEIESVIEKTELAGKFKARVCN